MDKEYKIEDKIQLKALLETYSVSEIADLLTSIDERIMSLHECSSGDFLKLNSDFKTLYQHAQDISNNIHGMLEALAGDKEEHFAGKIKSTSSFLNESIANLQYQFEMVVDLLAKANSQIRLLFFPLKNYAQSVTSFRFILTNLKLSLNCNDSEGCEEIEQLMDQQLENCEKLKIRAERIEQQANLIRKSFGAKSPQQEALLSDFNQVAEKAGIFQSFTEEYVTAFNDIIESLPLAQKKVESSNKGASEIITRLQYQDIIKQKMEHIQQTHKSLIQELLDLENESGDTKIHTQAKCFLKIRDIAGLQAAQLIHANKEYQNAVGIITDEFVKLGDVVVWFVRLAQNYYSEEGNNISTDFNLIKKKIEEIESAVNQFKSSEENLNSYIKENTSLLNQFVDEYLALISANEEAKELTELILTKLEKNSDNEAGEESIARQMKQVKKEISSNLSKIKQVFSETTHHSGQLKDIAERLTEPVEIKLSQQLRSLKESLQLLAVDHQKYQEQSIQLALTEEKITKSIRKSVSEIKYYHYFDKVVEDIITELNRINYSLKTEDKKSESMSDNLEHLKQYYTMETEHVIHDHVVNGKEEEIEIEEDLDDNIEFF